MSALRPKTILEAPVTQELVEYLEELFPPKCPHLTQPERDIFFYAGQVKFVEMLRSALEYQQRMRDMENGTNGTPKRGRSKADRLAGLQV